MGLFAGVSQCEVDVLHCHCLCLCNTDKSLLPACHSLFITQPQGIMLAEPSVNYLLKMLALPGGRHLQDDGLIEVLWLWEILLEEVPLDRGEWHESSGLVLI